MKKELEFFDHDVTTNVTNLLKKYPRAKDDDMYLVAIYYYTYYPKLTQGSAMDFLKSLSESRLVSSDFITRTRRKLQEHNEHLRGTKWKERHKKQEEVISDLHKVSEFKTNI
jgi:hypothetical protein